MHQAADKAEGNTMSVDVAVPASAVQALLKRARALVKKTPPVAPDPWPYPRWIAHRGAGKLAPENTLAAFRLGAAHGFRAFECDVKLSADGVPFLLHDAELDRTTSGQGLAALLPWVDLSQLDAGGWHSRQFAGEPPMTLAALARFVQANGCLLNLEIKPTPGDEHHTGREVASAAAGHWQAARVPPLLSSFQPLALLGALEAAPQLPRALLLDKLWPGALDVARALGCVAVVTNHRIMDAALRRTLQRRGLRALCYTVNEAADAQRLLALDIDGLITDAVDRFAPAADGLLSPLPGPATPATAAPRPPRRSTPRRRPGSAAP